LFFQLFFKIFLVPTSLDLSRDYIRNSNIDFFPNLIKEKKFIDSVKNLTIFVENKNQDGELEEVKYHNNLNYSVIVDIFVQSTSDYKDLEVGGFWDLKYDKKLWDEDGILEESF